MPYEPGVCNIGSAEIAGRRRAGHVGAGISAALFAALFVGDAPQWSRLLIALPASVSAAGYLQARLRFCAAYGTLGVYNFGAMGERHRIADAAARTRDRSRANRIGLASLAIGLAVGGAAALLPR